MSLLQSSWIMKVSHTILVLVQCSPYHKNVFVHLLKVFRSATFTYYLAFLPLICSLFLLPAQSEPRIQKLSEISSLEGQPIRQEKVKFSQSESRTPGHHL
jgi:hypothetical protein